MPLPLKGATPADRQGRVRGVRLIKARISMSTNFDVVVIGGGPGGYIAAIRAAQLGFNTACIDEWKNDKGGPAPGGTCTNVGCIPSKALLQSSEHFEHAGKHFGDHGIGLSNLSMDVAKMLGRKDAVVKQNNDGILYLFKKNKVSFFHGRGSFVKAGEGGYEVKVAGAAEETLQAKHVVVATGSNPRQLPGAPFDEDKILSNDGALRIPAVHTHGRGILRASSTLILFSSDRRPAWA